MKFFSSTASALLLLLPIAIDAAAIDTTRGNAVASRKVQARDDEKCTVDIMVKWLDENASSGPTIVFYAGRPDELASEEFAGTKGASDFDMAFGAQGEEWEEDCEAEGKDRDDLMSQAFAKHATGDTAWLVLGTKPIVPESYWVRSEYQIVKEKGMKIIAVSDTAWEKQQEYKPHENPWAE
ncbi:hypothetical protein MN608_10855 [Microdochium nivale]|nr:hypothetical protein MN608_10855 [Microdochium nivale]